MIEPKSLLRPWGRVVALTLSVLLLGIPSAREARSHSCPANRTIADPATLDSALRCAQAGTTLKLSAADFGAIEIRNPVSTLTIASANPAQPARFTGIAIHGAKGLSLRNLKIGGPPPRGWRYAVLIFRSSDFSAENLVLTGNQDQATDALDSAMMVRNVEGAKLKRLRLSHHRNGITLLDVRDLELVESSISQMRTDGIRGGGVNDALIARNVITSFHPIAGDHPDGIQLWSRNQKQSAESIVIEENIILRGAGSPIQGIFVEDRLNLPFRKVLIRNNLCVGTLYNGIMIMGGDGGTISGNIVIPLEPQISWIRVDSSRDITVTNNSAGNYMLNGKAARISQNKIGPIRREADAVVTAWRTRLNLPVEDFPL